MKHEAFSRQSFHSLKNHNENRHYLRESVADGAP